MLSREEMRMRPLLEVPKTVRIKFKKTGASVFISHLDLQRTFNRCLLRSGIPAWYTKGFNPHAKLVFSPPLPLGCESECELCDIKIERNVTNEEILECLAKEFTSETELLTAYTPKSKLNDIMYASYEVLLSTGKASKALAEKITGFFTTSPCIVMKRTKGGDKETDLTSLIESFVCRSTSEGLKFAFAVGDGKGQLLSPELIMKTAIEHFSLIEDEMKDTYTVKRTGLYGKDKRPFV